MSNKRQDTKGSTAVREYGGCVSGRSTYLSFPNEVAAEDGVTGLEMHLGDAHFEEEEGLGVEGGLAAFADLLLDGREEGDGVVGGGVLCGDGDGKLGEAELVELGGEGVDEVGIEGDQVGRESGVGT
jgi:hypothetical protein